jgi:hypothetical protein
MFQILQIVTSMVLFFVLFFGIGFILNMILRTSWIMAIIYPIVVIFIVDGVGFFDYFQAPAASFQSLWNGIITMALVDVLVLTCGFLGAIGSGLTINTLRKYGYRMF